MNEHDFDKENEEFFLTSDGGDEDEFFLTSEGAEEPLENTSPIRPMFERVQPPHGESPRPSLPPIPRPNRLDPNLLKRTQRTRPDGTRPEGMRPNGTRPPHRGDPRAPRPRKIASRKKHFAIMYIFALMAVIAGSLTFFAIYLRDSHGASAQPTPSPSPTPPAQIVVPPDSRHILAQIVRITPATQSLEVHNIRTGENRIFTYTESTSMTNLHGNPMIFEQLAVGQLLDVSFDARTNELLAAHQSRASWESRNRTNLRIDMMNDTITVGNDIFTFSHHHTLVLYRGVPIPISMIDPMNIVTLHGYGDHVWLIQLDTGHGTLQVINLDRVIGGNIEIGNVHFLPLVGLMPVTLQEGEHRVVINGQNIETFVHTVNIQQGETYILNLNDAELRTGLVHITVTPADAHVYINGEPRTGTGPVRMDFGEHLIRVEAYGYIPQEQVMNVTGSVGSIQFELQEAVRIGTLHVMTIPTNAQIFVNNMFVGHSELFHDLTLGTYTVTARLAGHDDSAPQTVEIVQGETSITLLLLPSIEPEPTPSPTPPPAYDGNPFPPPTPPPLG